MVSEVEALLDSPGHALALEGIDEMTVGFRVAELEERVERLTDLIRFALGTHVGFWSDGGASGQPEFHPCVCSACKRANDLGIERPQTGSTVTDWITERTR